MKISALQLDRRPRTAPRGFVLPLTLIISVIILTISAGISIILAKELYFSKLSRQSQAAYYAADSGLMCALMIDDHYIDPTTGIGIFQYNNLVTAEASLANINAERGARGYPSLTLNDIKCATSAVFNAAESGYSLAPFSRVDDAGNPESGQTTTFSMRMDLGDGTYRCATVLVNKTSTYRQIISRGFASCATAGQVPIERAIVNTTIGIAGSVSNGGGNVPPPGPSAYALTSGTSWTVPEGVTNLQVWSIGAGGGGAGAAASDDTSGGGGGAGGTAYRVFTVTPGESLSYVIGTAGAGGWGASDGGDGGDTSITINGLSLRGKGGGGGKYNSGARGMGGSSTGGSPDRVGGNGAGAAGDMGGGGGGALGEVDGTSVNCVGGTGGTIANATGADITALFAVLSELGYPTMSPGTGGGCGNALVGAMNGSTATGFGNGGGGAGYYGGEGGNGLYGGGGGGASGYDRTQTGGRGGAGIIIIYAQ